MQPIRHINMKALKGMVIGLLNGIQAMGSLPRKRRFRYLWKEEGLKAPEWIGDDLVFNKEYSMDKLSGEIVNGNTIKEWNKQAEMITGYSWVIDKEMIRHDRFRDRVRRAWRWLGR